MLSSSVATSVPTAVRVSTSTAEMAAAEALTPAETVASAEALSSTPKALGRAASAAKIISRMPSAE